MLLQPPVVIVILQFFFTPGLGEEDNDNEGQSNPKGMEPYHSTLLAIMKSSAKPNVAAGEYVKPHSVSGLVAIFKKHDFHCGGIIVNKYHVLTAERCIQPPESVGWYTVVAGENFLRCREGTEQVRGIEKILKYDHGDNPAKKAGIILLKLEKPLELDESDSEYGVKRANIVGQTHILPALGEPATLVGWGQTGETDPYSAGVRKVRIARVEQTACQNTFSFMELEHMVCFESNLHPHPSGCIGDEGSPLMCEPRGEVCGIAIYTDSCGQSGHMDMYVNLIPYIVWIYTESGSYAPEDKVPKHNQSFFGPASCGDYIQANSGVITLTNFVGGQICTWVLKTKYKFVRIRLLETTLLITDRIAAGALCDNCTEVVMDPTRTDLDHNITQGSVVMVQLIGGAGNNYLVGKVRGVKFLFSASGFPDGMKGFDQIDHWTKHIPSSFSYPWEYEDYENNKRVILTFSPLESGRKDLRVTFNRFDVDSENDVDCNEDYVEFYYTKWRANMFNQDGIHHKFARYCNANPPAPNFKYMYGHGWAIFRSNDDHEVGKGFEFNYTWYPSG